MTRAAGDHLVWTADDVLPARQPWPTFKQIARPLNKSVYNTLLEATFASLARGFHPHPPTV